MNAQELNDRVYVISGAAGGLGATSLETGLTTENSEDPFL
jgi:hypothetical protein